MLIDFDVEMIPLTHKGKEVHEIRWIGNGQYVAKIDGRDQRLSSDTVEKARKSLIQFAWYQAILPTTTLLREGKISVPQWCESIAETLRAVELGHLIFAHGGLDPKFVFTEENFPHLKEAKIHLGLRNWATRHYLEAIMLRVAEGETSLDTSELLMHLIAMLPGSKAARLWHRTANSYIEETYKYGAEIWD